MSPILAVLLLAAGTAIVCPFDMDTVVALSGDRLVATHYGLCNTLSGLGITLGNLATGALWDFARQPDALWLTWAGLPAPVWRARRRSQPWLAVDGLPPGIRSSSRHSCAGEVRICPFLFSLVRHVPDAPTGPAVHPAFAYAW
ncbi:hypothetical protein [Streptomyces shenzhenensis]|uniref:hypothetical protein n=1 Tax=Streptomyces shenzhenensis TaxID=943815 RepID=UPI003F5405AD